MVSLLDPTTIATGKFTAFFQNLRAFTFRKFIATADNVNIPEVLNKRQQFATIEEHYKSMIDDQSKAVFLKVHSQLEEEVRRGDHGKTCHCLMVNYINVMRNQHFIYI